MRNGAWKWGLALVFSGVVHAGAAFFLIPEPEAVRISGGGAAEIALAGNAFTDQIASGEVRDVVEPVSEATEAETVEPVTTSAQAAVQPIPQSTAEAVEVSPAEGIGMAPERPETVQPNEEAAIAIAPAPDETQPAETPQKEIEPVESDGAETAEQASEIKPDTPSETLTALEDVPVPTPRPHYEPPKRPELQQTRQPQRRQTAGSNGQNQQDSRRGASRGAEQAVAARQGTTNARANASGNAAISNYPGKIVAKLRRSLRYPSEARRQRLRGEVHVRFTVTQNGGVGGISVVRSSGSPVLDQAAIETVQRAAPFPTIPAGAGRTAWPFTVPLAFVR